MSELGIVNLPNLFMSRDPQEVIFSKTKYLATEGGYATMQVRIDTGSLPATGQSIRLDWPLGHAEFSVSPDAFSSVNIQDAGTFSGGGGDFCYFTFASFYANPALQRDFHVQPAVFDGTYGYFILRARQRGIRYNMTVTTNTTPLTITPTDTIDDVAHSAEQLNFYLDIVTNLCYETKIVRFDDLVAVADQNADGDRITYTFYELPALLRSVMGCDTFFPFAAFFFGSANWCYANYLPFATYVNAGDLHTDPVPFWYDQQPSIGDSIGVYAIQASQFPMQGADSSFLFMRRTPQDYLITQDQPIFATIFLLFALPYRLTVSVTYDDGTTDTSLQYLTTVMSNLIGTWPAGYRQLGFDQRNPLKTPVSMSVYLEADYGAGYSAYSEVLSYAFDTRYNLYNRYFLFQNSYGGYDTLRCRAVGDYETRYTRQTSATVRTSETTVDRGTIQMTYAMEERIWTMRTGWLLSQEELDWLRELLMTDYAAEIALSEYLYIPKEGQQWATPLRSVIVMQDSVKMYREGDHMYGLEWKMKYADDRYTPTRDSDLPVPYLDTFINFSVSVSVLGVGAQLYVDVDNGAQVFFNGTNDGSNTFNFYSGELNVTVEIRGYNVTQCIMGRNNCVCDITVTRISSPSLRDLRILCNTIQCTYLLSRLRTLPLVNLELESDPDLPTDQLLQLMCSVHDVFGLLQILVLFSNPPSADGLVAKNYLIAHGVTVITY